MRKRLKNSKDAAICRNDMLESQSWVDPITKEKIVDPVLDHNHGSEQEVRAVLERTVNSFEGRVKNAYHRYIKHLTDKDLPTVLRNLADYYESDYSANPIHHTALSVDVNKFKRLPASQQCSVLGALGLLPETNTKKRANQARKMIRDGLLNMNDIKKGA